ncbi:MAG: site-2 protease family protein [archaeon]
MSMRIARVMGIPVYLHYTILLAFGLVSWTLALNYMPSEYPGYSAQVYWIIGVTSAGLLFLSVFIHELAHSYVAKKNGISISRITLFIFGGVAQLGEDAPNADVEFKVSFAGPATSFIMAGLFGLIYMVMLGLGLGPVFYATFEYGAFVNGMLGGFNLVPAFPLDGGRILRATLWRRTRSLIRATRIASTVGVAFAYLFMFGGVFLLFLGVFVNGIWFMFIGWFLKNGAEASLRHIVITDALAGTSVAQIMTGAVDAIQANSLVSDAIKDYFMRYKHGGYPILDGENLVGILTLEDVRKVPESDRTRIQVKEIMTLIANVETTHPEETAADALMRLSRRDVGRLPVVQNGKLVGIITRSDLMHVIKLRTELQTN